MILELGCVCLCLGGGGEQPFSSQQPLFCLRRVDLPFFDVCAFFGRPLSSDPVRRIPNPQPPPPLGQMDESMSSAASFVPSPANAAHLEPLPSGMY